MTGSAGTNAAFLDTSVLVRYLVADVPERMPQITEVIDGSSELYLTGVVIAETAYVLMRVYGVPRETVVDMLLALTRRRNIRFHGLDEDVVVQALLLCRPSGRVSFADALLWATARSAGRDSIVYTLDSRFPTIEIQVRQRLEYQ